MEQLSSPTCTVIFAFAKIRKNDPASSPGSEKGTRLNAAAAAAAGQRGEVEAVVDHGAQLSVQDRSGQASRVSSPTSAAFSVPGFASAPQHGRVHAADTSHPWTGHTFPVGRGSREQLSVHLVVPEVVAEVAVDVARDSAGRSRHPVRLTRIRTDVEPREVPLLGTAS